MRIQSQRKSKYTNTNSRCYAANSMLLYSKFKPLYNRFFVPLDLNGQVWTKSIKSRSRCNNIQTSRYDDTSVTNPQDIINCSYLKDKVGVFLNSYWSMNVSQAGVWVRPLFFLHVSWHRRTKIPKRQILNLRQHLQFYSLCPWPLAASATFTRLLDLYKTAERQGWWGAWANGKRRSSSPSFCFTDNYTFGPENRLFGTVMCPWQSEATAKTDDTLTFLWATQNRCSHLYLLTFAAMLKCGG